MSSPGRSRALVLGGGGIAGIAWEIGLLSGLAASGVHVRDADLVVGTSAGSIVGTLLRTGADLEELYAAQLGPVPPTERAVPFDGAAFFASFAAALAGATGQQEARARIGALALRGRTMPESERLGVIGARIGTPEWPGRRLVVTVVDTADGEFLAVDRDTGFPLLEAVAASCAVPGVYPPITIGGRRFMDGGMRSVTNADLAAGCDTVLVVAPMAGTAGSPLGPSLDDEMATLRGAGEAHLVLADETAVRAFGTNPLDPATREPCARAGRAQGERVAEEVRAAWG
ncbi:NTE family protein [Geodermatophilus normandii]|uniref:NTE family protein n=1 Tax=Geodermatophilus normandii TaxID=1137989 RepID=A0A317QNU6_9ACTN|nr:patatin-like phospholipase family protein [Geodermatophilus normandii]PWW25032.1 NTE family protein [Geodermatophilus normandii]